jgi:hypothetical protein
MRLQTMSLRNMSLIAWNADIDCRVRALDETGLKPGKLFPLARVRLSKTVQIVREGALPVFSYSILPIFVFLAVVVFYVTRWVRNTSRTKPRVGGRWFFAGVILVALAIIAAIVGGIAWGETEEGEVVYIFVAVGSVLLFSGIVCLVVYYLLNESAKRAVRHEELMARLAAPQPQSPTTVQATGAVRDNERARSAPTPVPVASVAHGHPDVPPQALVADELTKLASLVEKGLVTREEFEAQKRVLLGVGPEPGTEVSSVGEDLPGLDEPVSEAQEKPAGLPSVVGKSFDVAVSTMCSAGYLKIQYSDATGQRRQPTTRSDWVVVGQRPNPGTDLAKDQPVVLGVKLMGE